jgi:hypothetical protein
MQVRTTREEHISTIVTMVLGFGMFAYFTLVFVGANG